MTVRVGTGNDMHGTHGKSRVHMMDFVQQDIHDNIRCRE